MSLYQELAERIGEAKPDKRELSAIKMQVCKAHGVKTIPSDVEVMLHLSAKERLDLLSYLRAKPQRSISGVAPVAIMSRPHKCPHGTCTYCPGGPGSVFGNVPQSYTGAEPTTRRAIRNKFDPYLQVTNRLEQYVLTGHTPQKVELILMGGTLPSLSHDYQERFVAEALKAMNDFGDAYYPDRELDIERFKRDFLLPADKEDESRLKRLHSKQLESKGDPDLSEEQLRNETNPIRCVGITFETRPSHAKQEHADHLLRLGCTRVELGVQTVYDDVLAAVNRGHSLADTIESTRTLKDLGLKINYHMMPGLPGVTRAMDAESLHAIFDDPSFRPDMLKIYPCLVMRGTKLYEDWKRGDFMPITTDEAARLIARFMPSVPEWCRMMRVQRDIPTNMTEDGVDKTNLRDYVERIMRDEGLVSRDIRAREIGRAGASIDGHAIRVIEYAASEGIELFIVAEKGDFLIGYCRLRIPSQSLREEITEKTALVRELHVYGRAAGIGERSDVQHRGIGKELLRRAEEEAAKRRKDKIVIISGIGVREYYRKLGYRREGPYMVKTL